MAPPRLLHNIASLGFLRVLTFALTLATIPYLTRVLGVETWGRVVFVQLIVNYLVWFCNWSFYLEATRKISATRDNSLVFSDVYMVTWCAQWALTAIGIVALLVASTYIPFFEKDRLLYVYSIGLLIGNALAPFWFLNGVEKIKEVAAFQMSARLLAVPLIFLFVRDSTDIGVLVAIYAGCEMLMGAVVVAWIRKSFLFSYSLPSWRRVFVELREGANLFASTVWANLYGGLVPTALIIFTGPTELGYYNLADRARGAATTILHPITHALFPRMCRLFNSNLSEAELLLKRSGTVVITISAILSLGLWLFAEPILLLLGGADFSLATESLKWLSVTSLLTTLSSFCVHQIIIPAQKNTFYHVAIFATLCLSALMVAPFIYWKQSEGAAIVTFVAEMFFAVIILIYLWKNKFFLKRPVEKTVSLA